jgi:lipid-A-disaccharide synthase
VDNIRKELTQLLHVKNYRKNMLESYAEMRRILGGTGASDRAAKVIVDKLCGK